MRRHRSATGRRGRAKLASAGDPEAARDVVMQTLAARVAGASLDVLSEAPPAQLPPEGGYPAEDPA